MSVDDRLSACARQARRYDRDRYLTALFARPDRREALFAIAAFNLEIAKTREVVTEPALGEIRLQWWREAVDELFAGTVRRHEVVEPLADAARRFDLGRDHFHRVIDARAFDLEDRAPADLAELEAYAEATAAPLNRLAMEVLAISGEAADRAAASLGTAAALIGLLRAIPFHARRRRVYLPTAVVAAVAVEMGDLFELRPHAGLARAVETLAAVAARHLEAGRRAARELPRVAAPVLLQAVLTEGYLRTFRKARYDVFAPAFLAAHPLRVARLAWRAAAGRF